MMCVKSAVYKVVNKSDFLLVQWWWSQAHRHKHTHEQTYSSRSGNCANTRIIPVADIKNTINTISVAARLDSVSLLL